MRKQYHLRPSERGVLAWDVDRLIRLSADLPRRSVKVNEIPDLDDVYWFRDEDRPPTCRAVLEHIHLIEAAELDYPIILSADGRVMDGMHRVAKVLLNGSTEIEAVQFEVDPKPDYVGVHPDDLPY